MWLIDDIEIRDVQLDFTSSSGGRPRTQALYAGDTCLVNALTYANLNEDPTQMIVCEACGCAGCQPGGWVHFRRLADSVVIIPAFAEMLDGDFELTEYSPPNYISSRGTPVLAPDVYERLRVLAPAFPSLKNTKSITASEAVWLTQWQAPLRILGQFPHHPQIVRDVIVAVSDGLLDDECDSMQQFVDHNVGSSADLATVDGSDAAPIEFHLDGPRFPAWRPLARVGEQLVFNFEPVAQLMVANQNAA